MALSTRLAFVVCVLGLCLGLVGGCSKELPRDTPEGTIASARQVVLDGHADRLRDFLYADDAEMKKLYARVGRLLLNVQKLGASIQERFPKEAAQLKADAEESVKQGKPTGLLAQMSGMMPTGGRGRNRGLANAADPAKQAEARKAFDEALKRFFADPYSFLRESDGKLAAVSMGDDLAALTWEGKPVLPPLGMVMSKDIDNRWYFVLPTNVPGVSSFMPKNKDQYQILGGLIQVFDNVVIDLRKDVDSGTVKSMDELARRAGEKAFVPAAIAFFAYAKYQDEAKNEAKKAASAAGASAEAPVSGAK
ncbi:MAG: hypothetical protein WC718_16235 [Phycisphaerales bacterium]